MDSQNKSDVKLSERVRSDEFQKEITMSIWQSGIKYTFSRVPTPDIGAIAGEIAALEQRLAEAEANIDESDAVRDQMRDLLEDVAIALKGETPKLTRWSWHDLAEIAKSLKAENEALRKDAERYRWLTEHYSYVMIHDAHGYIVQLSDPNGAGNLSSAIDDAMQKGNKG